MLFNRFKLLCLILFGLGTPAIAWAIPSPDLVINMFGSAAQLLGLSTVLLGAGFLGRRGVGSKKPTISAGWRRFLWLIVGLLVISLAANLLQYAYFSDLDTQRKQTNLWRSSTEAGKKVGDVSLKTLAFSDQLKHPRAISTETLDKWLLDGRKVNVIDVREREEFESGYIRDAQHSRYPDTRLASDKLIQPDAENVLLCFSGNRSSELCTEFAKQGKSCRFVIGGYEKWMAEGRSMSGGLSNERINLRELPSYPNQEVLLDTATVVNLVANKNAVFVDVRYPGDYDKGHLPGAINLPIRKMTTVQLEQGLASLPRRPIIAPCYDKRSCFYGEILGIRLHRAGHEFLGRYTVPHEYSLPKKQKEYVANWQKMQSQTLFDMAIYPLQQGLIWLHISTGSFALSIILLVVLLRILVLPVSLKAERDSAIMSLLKPEMASLKEKWGEDKQRFSSAVMKLYRQHGLTPGRNLFGTLIQLILFLAFFSAVNTASQGVSESLLWVPALGQSDPSWALPILVGLLMFMQILATTTRRSKGAMAAFIVLSALITALCIPLSAAVSFYLVLSLGFIVLQTKTVKLVESLKRDRQLRQKAEASKMLKNNIGLVALKDAHRFRDSGNKAGRLGQMHSVGLPVPDGFLVTDSLLSASERDEKGQLVFSEKASAEISAAHAALGYARVAVRSTGLAEDGAEQSFAGVFDSVLNVERDGLLAAISQVRQSYHNARAASYSGENHGKGSVLVQTMVDAEYAGVMFTVHPTSSGCMLIEMVEGLGEALVSGTATPLEFSYGILSGETVNAEEEAPVDLSALISLGRKVESLFGKPQDIEWAYKDGQFFILQARDITASVTDSEEVRGRCENERRDILSCLNRESEFNDVVLQQNELAELLPDPTPLSLSIMEGLWDIGGTTDIACQRLGIAYQLDEESAPYMLQVFGKLYVNIKEGQRRFVAPGSVAAFQLSRAADSIEQEFKNNFLPRLSKEMRLREALDLSQFSLQELITLLDEWFNCFVKEDYVQAEIINIAADFYIKTASQALQKRGLNASSYLGHGPETIMHHVMGMLPGIKKGERPLKDFLDVFGYRAVHDYELSEPRYRESEKLVQQMVRNSADTRPHETEVHDLPDSKLLRLNVDRARRFQSLKEDAKHYCMREYATLRPLLLEIDNRLELDGGIFYLSIAEVLQLSAKAVNEYQTLIKQRMADKVMFSKVNLPTSMTIKQLEGLAFNTAGELVSHIESNGALMGNRVAGEGDVTGTVRILNEIDPADSVSEGDILIARYTDPRWIPLFSTAKGIVTEVGGWLSHMTIVAREYNLPCVVGAKGVMDQLQNGQKVKIREDGMIDRRLLKERRVVENSPRENDDKSSNRKTERRKH